MIIDLATIEVWIEENQKFFLSSDLALKTVLLTDFKEYFIEYTVKLILVLVEVLKFAIHIYVLWWKCFECKCFNFENSNKYCHYILLELVY